MSRLKRIIGVAPDQLRSLGFDRKALPWYRDLALATICSFALVGGVGNVANWNASSFDLRIGLLMLGIASACGLLSPNRLLIWSVAFWFLAFRGLVALLFEETIQAVSVTIVAGLLAYALLRLAVRGEREELKANKHPH